MQEHAVALALACCVYRVPEPIRDADKASRADIAAWERDGFDAAFAAAPAPMLSLSSAHDVASASALTATATAAGAGGGGGEGDAGSAVPAALASALAADGALR